MNNNIVPHKFQFLLRPTRSFLIAVSIVLTAASTLARQYDDRSANDFFEQAELHVTNQQWREAELAYTQGLQLAPQQADAYYHRGMAREKLGQLEKALADYNVYVDLKPFHPEGKLNRAMLLYRMKRYSEAETDFQDLLTMPQSETSTVYYRQNLFSGRVDQVFTMQGNDRSYLFSHLGLIKRHQKEHALAVMYFDSAIQQKPLEADYYVNRGLVKAEAGDIEGARKDYQDALRYNNTHEIARHNLLVLLGDSKSKAAALDSLIAKEPSTPYALAERGYQRMQSGLWKAALEDYNNAIAIDSTDEEYFLNRGLVKEKLKDNKGAYADFTRAIALRENFDKAWMNRASLLARTNQLNEAIEDYTIALYHNPNYASAYYNRALANHRLGRLDAACADLNKAKQLGQAVTEAVFKRICK